MTDTLWGVPCDRHLVSVLEWETCHTSHFEGKENLHFLGKRLNSATMATASELRRWAGYGIGHVDEEGGSSPSRFFSVSHWELLESGGGISN